MNLLLLTMRKDARRLWPVALITMIMLAEWARLDRWRGDRVMSSTENWLTILLIFAWSCLAALAVFEEPLVGDRHFWMTRPHRWAPLLGAKLLFLLAAVHLPYLVANLYILAERGFSPAGGLGAMLRKEALLFAALTLPAVALATLLRNFAHFVGAAFAIGILALILNDGFDQGLNGPPMLVRRAALLLLIGAAAGAIVAIQYSMRRILAARVVAAATLVVAAGTTALFPARAEYSRFESRSGLRIQLADAIPDSQLRQYGITHRNSVMLPIHIEADPAWGLFRVSMTDVEVVGPRGSVRSERPRPNHPGERHDLVAYLTPAFLSLTFSDEAWKRVKDSNVEIRGDGAFEFYRRAKAISLPIQGAANVAGVGRCITSIAEDPFSNDRLKVLCESPEAAPAAEVHLQLPGAPGLRPQTLNGSGWSERLSSFGWTGSGPQEDWLSPLHRTQVTFPLISRLFVLPGEQWQVPRVLLSRLQLTVVPEIPAGEVHAHFSFANVALETLRQ